MESTSITYTLSEAEFIRAARAYWAYEAIGDRSNIIVAILCASAGPVLLSYGQNVGWAFLFFAVFFLALTAARNWIWRSSYRKMIKYRDDISVSFEQDKLDVRSAEGASSLLWTQFKSYAETPD